MEEQPHKFVLRSRRVQLGLIAVLNGLRMFLDSVGVTLPEGAEGYVGSIFDSLTSDTGVIANGLRLLAAGHLTWTLLRWDNAKLTLLPFAPGAAKVGQVLALLLALLIPLAAPASAAIAPYQPQLRIAWVGQVAGYRVYAYQGAVVPVIEPWRPATGP